MSSEIAQLMARIDRECEAMKLAMNGFAIVGRHQIIARRYDNLGTYQKALAQLVSQEEAALVVHEAYARAMETFDEQGGMTK